MKVGDRVEVISERQQPLGYYGFRGTVEIIEPREHDFDWIWISTKKRLSLIRFYASELRVIEKGESHENDD